MAVKYVFVTGGVVSGLGKGITAASLGRLLKARGYKAVSYTHLVDGYYYHRKRIYHQRFPPGCFGQWNCHRGKLVGKIENNQPDDYDHSSDRRHSGTFRAEYRADLGCTDSDRCFSD